MKIAQIAPMAERVPAKKYGGTERMIHALTEELVKRGHEVTLFASGDSITSAKLVSVYPKSLREARMKDIYGANALTLCNIGLAYERQNEFDIIHDHNAHLALPVANIATTPTVSTMHGPFTTQNRWIYQMLQKPNIVTISNDQSRSISNYHHAGTVYNGLYMDHYPFSQEEDGYLLYVGRISAEKGVHYALEVALYLNMPLILAAKVDPTDMPYFREYIEPHLSDQIQWIGEVDEAKRNELMTKAKCFLHPVVFREPFGLTLIEAAACGCPVVGFRRGAIPEIIENGKTGFVVTDVEEMVDAVINIDTIDRTECRKHVLEKFSAQKMADGYEAVYQKILNEKK
jgi:glycosyltransferase involved in cell wall biosynthesis